MVDHDQPGAKDLWAPFQFFLGSWRGTGSGSPGSSFVKRSYVLTLADQFIEVRSRSEFPPQEKNPSGEVHEDLGMISYDKARSLYVMREFLVEGYVNQYVLEPPAEGSEKLVFVTEAIENMPAGWRVRTTLVLTSADSFLESFDLSGPGKEWACLLTIEFQRERG